MLKSSKGRDLKKVNKEFESQSLRYLDSAVISVVHRGSLEYWTPYYVFHLLN
jgi:hypothetical protein